MPKFVLVRMNDEAVEKFVKKAGSRAVGVWDSPGDTCTCPGMYTSVATDWTRNESGWPECKKCGGLYRPIISVGRRLRNALGRNIIKQFR